ncbi:polysaccharide pyruvyl transferase family protein, partial [bacterium]|nr:polysaccharide pyruvyl transferase family protein [bacterium]
GGYDKAYFLNFKTNSRKAFYAISDGNAFVTEDNFDYYYESLKNIPYISTREKSLADDIVTKFGKKACGVVDPSFLLNKQEYIMNFKLRKSKRILFAYFIEEDQFMESIVRVLSQALKLEIVELHYYKKLSLKHKYQRADLGPIDFLEGIYNADFVITNSFHGTAFSIIFHKQFYSVYNDDARKDNLLSELGLQRRKINNAIELDLNDKIDYNEVNIKTYIDSSKKFLDVVLKDNFSVVN